MNKKKIFFKINKIMCSAESFDFDAFEELCFRDDPISSEKYGVRVMNIQQTGTFFKQLVFI